MPEPITSQSVSATEVSIRIGQSAGSPIGVIPPYSIEVSAVAWSSGRGCLPGG
ncbi:MAG: hypothetical protein R2709_14575 [Marmoricola sp.]